MSSHPVHKRRSYSFFYKIYRRLRFIRYRKRLIKQARLDIKKQQMLEQNQHRIQVKEFRIAEKQARQLKLRAERLENRKLKKEFREEFRQREKLAKQEWKALTLEEKKQKKKALRLEKKERKKLFRQNLKSGIKYFFLSFRSFNISNFRQKLKSFRENASKRRRFYLISFNSTVLFLLSYFGFFLFAQFITVLAARFFDYPTTVYYYQVYFNIGQEDWFHDSVKTIFSSGPVVNFVIGIFFLIIYSNIRENASVFKLFFLWGFLHAINMLFGALLVGTLFEAGVGHVMSWMYIMDTGRVLFSIFSIFLMVVAGLIATKQFLISGNSYYNEINEHNRTSFIIPQVLVPYLAGNLLLLLIREPRFVFYDTFIVVALFISILPILITYRSYHELYYEEDEKKPRPLWIEFAILLLVVAFFRGVLEVGLRFGG